MLRSVIGSVIAIIRSCDIYLERRIISGISYFIHNQTPLTFMFMILSKASDVSSTNVVSASSKPALLSAYGKRLPPYNPANRAYVYYGTITLLSHCWYLCFSRSHYTKNICFKLLPLSPQGLILQEGQTNHILHY